MVKFSVFSSIDSHSRASYYSLTEHSGQTWTKDGFMLSFAIGKIY